MFTCATTATHAKARNSRGTTVVTTASTEAALAAAAVAAAVETAAAEATGDKTLAMDVSARLGRASGEMISLRGSITRGAREIGG